MSIYNYPARKASNFVRKNTNKNSYWNKERLNQRYFTPEIKAQFKIKKTDNIFAIGSCFAREIESALINFGYNVLSIPEFPDGTPADDHINVIHYLNKYSTASILNELKWALVPNEKCPDACIIEISKNKWIDLQCHPTFMFSDKKTTLKRKCIVTSSMKKILDCRVVFVTLGLTEVWKDLKTGLHTNTAPPTELIENDPKRYQLEVLGYQENYDNLTEICHLLRNNGHSNIQIIITISPVSLMATFTDRDLIIANTFSKSVLRTVAEEVTAKYENVHYFPSYEITLNSDPSLAWAADRRHTSSGIVSHIINLFTKAYL